MWIQHILLLFSYGLKAHSTIFKVNCLCTNNRTSQWHFFTLKFSHPQQVKIPCRGCLTLNFFQRASPFHSVITWLLFPLQPVGVDTKWDQIPTALGTAQSLLQFCRPCSLKNEREKEWEKVTKHTSGNLVSWALASLSYSHKATEVVRGRSKGGRGRTWCTCTLSGSCSTPSLKPTASQWQQHC